jgi:hypothetical protein
MSREPWPLFGILPSGHLCIHAHQMAGATIASTCEKCGLVFAVTATESARRRPPPCRVVQRIRRAGMKASAEPNKTIPGTIGTGVRVPVSTKLSRR